MGAALVAALVLAAAVLNDRYVRRQPSFAESVARQRHYLLARFLLGLCALARLSWTPVLLTGRVDPTLLSFWSAAMVVVVTLVVCADGTGRSVGTPKCSAKGGR